MAYIELMIKIPKELYESYKGIPPMLGDVGIDMIAQSIANGTPLPKGHGRLKDIDEIKWYGCTSEDDCPYKNRDCKDCDRAECSKTQFDSIPVLIPADKGEEV